MTCPGCVTENDGYIGEHVHCPTCDAVMVAHPWAICGRCNPGEALVIEPPSAGRSEP